MQIFIEDLNYELYEIIINGDFIPMVEEWDKITPKFQIRFL